MTDIMCTLIGVYTDVFILYAYLDVCKTKISKSKIIALFAVYGVINVILNVLEVNYIVKLSLCIFLCICIILAAYQEMNLFDAIKYTITFFTLLGIGELLIIPMTILGKEVYDIDLLYSESNTLTWILTLIISRIITIILIRIVGRYWYKIRIKTNKIEKILLYFPLLMSFVLAVVVSDYLMNIDKFNKQDLMTVLTIVSVLLMAFTITNMKILEKNIIMRQQEKQITDLEHQNEMQYLFFEEKNKYETEIKRIRHDLKNHLLLIKDMNQIQAKDYYEGLLEAVSSEDKIDSGCNVFDVLINEKRKNAEQKDIHFDVCIIKNISCINYIENRDLCSIFGNLIDNAIENAAKVTNAKILIKVDVINSFFVMIISNTYNHSMIKKENKKFLTTKEDYEMHGIGLESVKMSIEKYEGHIKIVENASVFKVEIMLPINYDSAK